MISTSAIGGVSHDRPADLGSGPASVQYGGQAPTTSARGRTTQPSASVYATPGTPVPRLSIRGEYIFTPDGLPIRPRGWNWGAKHSAQAQDALDNANQGANVVRVPLSWYYGDGAAATNCGQGQGQDSYDSVAPGFINPQSLEALDQQVQWASDAHLWVDVMVRGGDCDFWSNGKIKSQYIQMWEFLANHYKDTPYIASYSLLSEPHPPVEYSNNDVRDLYRRTIRAVRAIDNATPIVIGPGKNYDIRNLEQIYMPDQVNIAYAVNFYELPAYVKQGKETCGHDRISGMVP